jgi:SAM-dependent methyltransferase
VGAGQGHFARAWAPHLARGFEIVCVDPEARSLAVAEARGREFLARTGLEGTFTYVQARAEQLPFEDDRFDAAMCQTVLIHLAEPALAVREMTRVVRRGGTVLAAEPNNFATAQLCAAHGPDADPEAMTEGFRFYAYCMRGKHRLGLGWNNLGVHLPRWFGALADVRYYQNDRPSILAPPYDDAEQRAVVQDLASLHARGIWCWEREEARRYFVAGGGDPAAFDAEYDAVLSRQAEEVAAMERGAWCALTAVALLVAAGTKR